MAGADDIVKQALRLVMGGGGDDAAKVALRQSAQQATDIPAHLRPGFKVEAAPGADEETRNLVDYLSQRDPSLSFDPQSLAERRQDLGTTVPAFHGSPRNIERFTNQYSSPEGYWGGHHYFTTSPVDASVNYATPEGADLFRRLEGSVERTLDNFHPGDVTEWYAGKYGSSEGINPVDPKIVKEYADDIARQELGITNEGAVYPVNLRMKNPVKIDSPNQTFWGYDTQYDEAGDIVSEGGPAADLLQATRDALADYNVRDREADELIGKLYEAAVDYGGIDAKSYNDILRGSHMDLYDEEGNMVSMGHIMADAFRRMGHDSIDMPTDVFAGGLGRVGMAGTGGDTRHYIIFDPKNVRSRFGAFDPFKAASERISDAEGGAIEGNDDDIDDAIRIAKDVGGSASVPVMMEDAKGNKYDAQGNIIPPTNPGPNPARSDVTPQSVAAKAVNDPATYDALMERYAVPDRDIVDYEALKETVGKQPQAVQQMTHVGDRPLREMTINMPLFGGEYSMGSAPYDVAEGLQGVAQTAYDFKTMPAYFFPPTAPFALGADVLESRLADDPLGFALNVALTPQGASAAKSALGAVRRNPKATAAAIGAGAYLSPDEAEAGPERWFSKAMEVARALPMEKMTGQQALAMLRKGVSPEELRWTGADTFLPQQKQITKQDLVDYLAKNRVQMNEVVLGGNKPTNIYDVVPSDQIKAKYQPKIDEVNQKLNSLSDIRQATIDRDLPSYDENYMSDYMFRKESDALLDELSSIQDQIRNDAVAEMGGLAAPTKYQDYSTAGGEGYTETLYQFGRQKAKPSVVKKDGMWEVVDESGEVMRSPDGKAYSYWSQNDADRAARSLYRESGSYQSPHWNDPDVIAHTRSNTLAYEPPGSNRPYKVHNVEETQSDLAQQGRKTGFRTPDIDKRLNELELERNKLNSQHSKARQEIEREFKEATKSISDEYNTRVRQIELAHSRGETNYREYEEQLGDAMTWYGDSVKPYREKSSVRYMAEVAPLEAQEEALRREVMGLNKNKNLPPLMPYVGSTEGWTDFAIKRELDKALDSDADYFSWSPGDVHAERYDLSKHISRVQYNPDDGSLLAYDPKGKMVVNESVNDPDDLDEYVGKELADKMRSEEAGRRADLKEAMSVDKDEDGRWTVFMNGEQMYDFGGEPRIFRSKGEANDYLNELLANEFTSNPIELSGLDLKVGGEGMRGYYDKIYLKRVQDVIKKSTGVKPEIETITVNTADGPRQQLGIRITDEMREKARFSDFNKGGRVADPAVNKALSLTRGY